MAYIFPIQHWNIHTIYNQNTLHLIGQCDVAMVTDSHFEYANKVVKCLKIVFLGSMDIQKYNIISINIKYINIHHRRFEEAFNRSISRINKVNKLLSFDIVSFLSSLRGIPNFIF